MLSIKVSDLMTKNVVTVSPNDTLQKAIELMSKRGVGSVVVVENNRVVGILTERDIIKALAKGVKLRKARISSYMTKNVAIIEPDADVSAAVDVMRVRSIKHLPVVLRGYPVGVVSARDVVAINGLELARYMHDLLVAYHDALRCLLGEGFLTITQGILNQFAKNPLRGEVSKPLSVEDAVEHVSHVLKEAGLIAGVRLSKRGYNRFVMRIVGCRIATSLGGRHTHRGMCPLAFFILSFVKDGLGVTVRLESCEPVEDGSLTLFTLA